jgi:hypothetical protein
METISYEISQQLTDTLRLFANNEELFDSLASIYRKTFLALTKAGFTEEQAMQIVSRQGFK